MGESTEGEGEQGMLEYPHSSVKGIPSGTLGPTKRLHSSHTLFDEDRIYN